MRIAAIGDLHCKPTSAGEVKAMLEGVEDVADVLVLTGDLTNMGTRVEMEIMLNDMKHIRIPVIAVVGNHDHESDQLDMLEKMMRDQSIHVLDGNTCTIDGVGFVGTKGFCGGFANLAVQPFGEQMLKRFIQASIDEAMILEKELSELKCSKRVALLHFSPIRETLEGEEKELYPFLGSSLLATAIDRHGADVIFHGHAHKGSHEGKTPGNIPVFNVCRFVQVKYRETAYFVYEI